MRVALIRCEHLQTTLHVKRSKKKHAGANFQACHMGQLYVIEEKNRSGIKTGGNATIHP